MERNQVLEEYWQLRKSLNQGNKLANEQTDLIFMIEPIPASEFRLLVIAKSTNEELKIELARRDRHGDWERSGFTSYKNLETFCALTLNKQEKFSSENSKTNQNEASIISLSEVLNLKFKNLLLD